MTILARIFFQSLLVGVLAVVLLHVRPFSAPEPFRFVVKMSADTEGRARLFNDHGHGFAMHDALGAAVSAGQRGYDFPLPDGTVRALRFWPLDRAGKVTIHSAAVVGPGGAALYQFSPPGTELSTEPGEGLDFRPPEPLALHRTLKLDPTRAAADGIIAASVVAMILFLWSLLPARACAGAAGLLGAIPRALERLPRITLLLAACAATTLSCHPVVFGGKSFVSPGNGAQLLYDDAPTLPGGPTAPAESPRGADVGAIMWAHVPYSVTQHRAIFEHGELPLWNRYVYCGTPLLGQGISMIGDPLHWLPISQAGAAWAWDVKFLLAKTLFSLGIAFCVYAATGRLWLSAVLALSSSFLGFFSYRFNHPAFFALCYSPWIVFAWLRAAASGNRVWPWALALAFANVWQLNSGVMKESAMLVAGLNFTGALLVLLAPRPAGECCRRFMIMLWGCALAAAISAPGWMLFLDALRHSWTPYAAPAVTQIIPSLAIGIFDDLFYRQFTAWENHFNPSANFLILLGCVWALVNIRTLLTDRAFIAITLGAIPSALLAFGIIPAALISQVPFLGNIGHVDNTFSVVLIVHLVLIAAFGLRELWENASDLRMGADSMLAMAIVATMLALYFGTAQAAHREARSLLAVGDQIPFGRFFLAYSGALLTGVLALPWIVRSLREHAGFGAPFLGALALFVIHFRHGMWEATQFDYYVMNPRPRAGLMTPSQSLEYVRKTIGSTQPARIAGFKDALVPGYNGVLGLEHFAGAEPLVNRNQHDLCEAIGGEARWGWRWRIGDGGDHKLAARLCNLWGVYFFIAMPCEIKAETPARRGDLALIENPDAWPRAFFTDRLVRVNALPSFLALLESHTGKPFATVMDEPDLPATAPGISPASKPSTPATIASRQTPPCSRWMRPSLDSRCSARPSRETTGASRSMGSSCVLSG
jgi:hypothetical protein